MKGDRVEIVIDAGSGTTRTYEVTATRAGRRVNVTHGREHGIVEAPRRSEEECVCNSLARKPNSVMPASTMQMAS